jgi:hypothetical protein
MRRREHAPPACSGVRRRNVDCIGSTEGHEYPDLQVGDEVNPRPFLGDGNLLSSSCKFFRSVGNVTDTIKPASRPQVQPSNLAIFSDSDSQQNRVVVITLFLARVIFPHKKCSKTYTYWMASWREGDKTRNVHWEAPGRWMPRRPGRGLGIRV